LEILILLVVLLVIGPRRIVNLFSALGRGAHDFVEQLGGGRSDKELPPDEERDPEETDSKRTGRKS
jgi:Sec-independent protein translocase protein TatA